MSEPTRNVVESTTLLPCPFCGGRARLTKTNHETWVSCEHYHYERHIVSMRAKTEAEAIAAWNRRAEKPTLSDLYGIWKEADHD